MSRWRIVSDIGGSNARLARSAGAGLVTDVVVRPTGRGSFEEMLLRFLDCFEDLDGLEGVAIAAAGPVDDGIVSLTNANWTIEASAVSAAIGGRHVRILNDLEAVAWSIPVLQPDELEPIVAPAPTLSGPVLVVNVGTGFGAALLVSTPEGRTAVACEPGHMKLAGCDAGDDAMDVPSVEDVISGRALGHAGKPNSVASAGDCAEVALGDARFGHLLGQVCGDLVLACGAWGGVCLCGSVADAWCASHDRANFLAAFVDKGPMRQRMERVSVKRILAPNPGLIGLSTVPLGAGSS